MNGGYLHSKLLCSCLLIVLLLTGGSTNGSPAPSSSYVETNFEVWYFMPSGNRLYESIALYIKQALVSLGIDVKIIAKPWGQIVSDLQHYSTGFPFDIFATEFSYPPLPISPNHLLFSSSPTPHIRSQYHSQSHIGRDIYQLDNHTWQDWQVQDTGIYQTQVDSLLDNLEYEGNPELHYHLLEQFNELFMTKLLYDLPLVQKVPYISMWRGYGGPENELWDPGLGVLESRSLGATWDPESMTPQHQINATHLRLPTVATQAVFDPFNNDLYNRDITQYMHSSLLAFDAENRPHPDLAYNFYEQKLENSMEYTFLIRDDAYWSPTTDLWNKAIDLERVDADDFRLSLDMCKHSEVSGKELYDGITSYRTSSTLSNNDTLHILIDNSKQRIDDYFILGSLKPLPVHILGNISLSDDPMNDERWNHWVDFEGHSLVGPYEMVEYKIEEIYDEEVYFSYQERMDYYYPNEWDTTDYYNQTAFAEIENSSGMNMSIFAPHLHAEHPDAYFWAYLGDEKPSNQPIQSFDLVGIDDINTWLLKYEAGAVDIFETGAQGTQLIADHESNPDMVTISRQPSTGPISLVFNLQHDHLRKFNVRKAIAHVIDKHEIVKIFDGLANISHSVVPDLYPISGYELNYNYNISRDLMRYEGYDVFDCPGYHCGPPPPTSSFNPTPFNPSRIYAVVITFLVASILLIDIVKKILKLK